jgi:hypothetical protein
MTTRGLQLGRWQFGVTVQKGPGPVLVVALLVGRHKG